MNIDIIIKNLIPIKKLKIVKNKCFDSHAIKLYNRMKRIFKNSKLKNDKSNIEEYKQCNT